MSVTVIITQIPDSPASQQAKAYCLKHQSEISLIFFFDQGVTQAISHDDFWQKFAEQSSTMLCCCIDSVERHLGKQDLTAPFIVSGMGKLAQSCDHTTQTVLF